MKVPDRKDDSPEEFAKQQDAIAKQVQAAIDAKVDAAVQRILDKGE